MKKSAVIVSVILLFSACSLFKPKIAPYPTGVIFPVEKAYEMSYKGEVIPPIREQGDLLYFSTRTGNVYCVDGRKQETLWEVEVPEDLVSPCYLSGDRVYTGSSGNKLYCVHLSGELLWESSLEERITSGVAESGGQVYAGTEKGTLFGLDAATGKEIWRFEAGGAVRSNLVIWQEKVLFGCDDGLIYFVDRQGRTAGSYNAGGKTGETLTIDSDHLYFGTDDRYLHCMNLSRKKKEWKIQTGGAAFVAPVAAGKRIFFLCWNCVLYCLDKRSGTILWWNPIPSRSYYRVEVIETKVVVSSFSPELVCFDVQTGEKKGSFNAYQEIKSNPVWLSPYLLVGLQDQIEKTGKLLFLEKSVKATLTSSPASPAEPNEEVTFSAGNAGFYLPQYEFSLSRNALARVYPGLFFPFLRQDEEVVQESSEQNTWDWFPENEGLYRVGVVVVDEKEKASAEMIFLVREKRYLLSLSSSIESPQRRGREIDFKAHFSGFTSPQFEFRLSRLERVNVIACFPHLILGGEEIVQERSDAESWTWTPEKEGVYFIKVHVQGSQKSASAVMVFVVRKEEKGSPKLRKEENHEQR